MSELTNEQKADLKCWEKKLHICGIIGLGWTIIMVLPLILLERKFGDVVWYINGIILGIWFVVTLYIRHYKKCPNCNTRIGGWGRLLFLPKICHKCGVEFR